MKYKYKIKGVILYIWFQFQRLFDWLIALFVKGKENKIKILLDRKLRRLAKALRKSKNET